MSKVDEIIQRYAKGMVYEKDTYSIILEYGANNHNEFILRLVNAVKDFLENADIQESNDERNKKELKIFANLHGLKNYKSQEMFEELLKHVLTNRVIISEYNNWTKENSKILLSK